MRIPKEENFRTWKVLLILGLFGVCVFANTLNHRFNIDEYNFFFQDSSFQSPKFSLYQWIPNFRQVYRLDEQRPELYYRPLNHTLMMASKWIFQDNTRLYQVSSIFFWVAAAGMVYSLLSGWTKKRVAFGASLFFLVHPMNGLMLNNKTCFVYSVMLIFMCASAILQRRWQEQKNMGWLAASLFLYLLASLIHEMGLLLPIYLIFVERYVRDSSWRKSFWEIRYHGLIFFVFFLWHLSFTQMKTVVFANWGGPGLAIANGIFASAQAVALYVEKLLVPIGIVINWTRDVTMGAALLAWLIVAAGVGALIILRRKIRWEREIRLSLAWLVTGFFVIMVTSVLSGHGRIVVEPHWMLFPSLGFFLLVALVIDRGWQSHFKKAVVLICTGLLLFWSGLSFVANSFWANQRIFAAYWLTYSPHNSYLYFLLASGYQEEGDYARAEIFYKKCLALGVVPAKAYDNLGIMALDERKYKEAEDYFQLALAVNPKQSIFWNNLGSVYLETRRFEEAKTAFERAIELNPLYYLPRANLGQVYHQEGKLPEALTFYDEYLEITPRDQHIVLLAMTAALESKDGQQVEKFFNQARQWIDDPAALTQIGSLLASKGDFPQAFALYEKALRRNPQFIPAYVEMGKLLANQGDLDGARRVWSAALPYSNDQGELLDLLRRSERDNYPAS